jgi:hypothetical protein
MQQQQSFHMDALKALVASNCISDLTYQSALECWSMIRSGELTADQAVIALQMSDRNRSPLEDALSDLGFRKVQPAPATEPAVPSEIAPPDTESSSAWSTFMESKLLITNFVIGAIALWATMTYCPEGLRVYAVCAVFFIVFFNQFALGKSWQQSQERRRIAKAERIKAAKQTSERLGKKK